MHKHVSCYIMIDFRGIGIDCFEWFKLASSVLSGANWLVRVKSACLYFCH